MLIPLAVVDDVVISDLGQQHPRTHNNMLHPVYVLFDSRTMSHYHHPTTTPPSPWSVNMYNNVPTRLMSHNHNHVPRRLLSHNRNNVSSRSTSSTSRNNVSSRFTSSTVSVVDETLVYDSTITGNIPRTRSFNLHHHNNGTRASSSPVIGAAVLMGVQEHVTTSTTDAESICCICLAHLSNASSTPIRLRCSHIFHTECIQKWVNIRQTCPLCRADV